MGEDLEEFGGDIGVEGLGADLDGVSEAEDEGGAEGAERCPAAEDEGGEGDITTAVGHADGESTDPFEREPDTGEASEEATDDDIHIAGELDVDAEGIGGAGVFTDGAEAQAPRGIEENIVNEGGGDEHEVDDRLVFKEDFAEKGDLGEEGDFEWGEGAGRARPAGGDEVDLVHVGGEANGEDINDHTANDLVRFEADGDDTMEGGHEGATEEAGEDAEEEAIGITGDKAGEHSGGEHHAFDGDVNDTGTFTKEAGVGAEGDGGGGSQR